MTLGARSDRSVLADLARVYLADPNNDRARARLVRGLIDVPDHPAGTIDDAVAALAADEHVNHERLVPYAVDRLEATPVVADALAMLRSGARLSPKLRAAAGVALSSPLIMRLLSDYLLASEAVETLIVALRRDWLEAAVTGTGQVGVASELVGAVGLQMHLTEWVFQETAEEVDQLAALERLILNRVQPGDAPILIYALYRPLREIFRDSWESVTVPSGDRPRELFRRHLAEPADLCAQAEQMPRLTAITDAVSRAVRAQYEERPYPRWRHLGSRRARRLGETVANAIAAPSIADDIDVERPRILIAGAGTGRHAVMTAVRYAGARVLAVDLSRAALAYGAYQAQRLDVQNICFAQADIAELAALDETFDVVECMGVLHHMADPEQGWGELRSLIRPGGLMKLGLYSSHGRSFLDPAKAIIAARGFEPTIAGIRAFRSTLRCSPMDSPARRVMRAPDFYSISGCRDLFFHAHEDRFDLPRIQRAIEALDLEFLGFELATPRLRDLYRSTFPDDPTARSLSNWDFLEQRHPQIFSSMYRFWVRVPGRRLHQPL